MKRALLHPDFTDGWPPAKAAMPLPKALLKTWFKQRPARQNTAMQLDQLLEEFLQTFRL